MGTPPETRYNLIVALKNKDTQTIEFNFDRSVSKIPK
jgi:hypothetical protein